jgi:hypothetical protein
MTRKRLAAFAIILMPAFAFAARADDLSVKLVNNTSSAISTVTATPKGASEPSNANVLAGEIAPSETGVMTVPHEADQCMFDLQITFGGGLIADRPDIDLCQADGIVIE